MNPADLDFRAEIFRLALGDDDLSSAEAAMREYVACFRSKPRTLVEVAQAQDTIEAGLQIVVARKAALAAELARITTVSSVYSAPRISNTWRLDA